MPAWILIAVAGMGGLGVLAILVTLAGGRYEGQHVLDDVQAEWDAHVAEHGSMILAEEHPLDPLPAPPVDPHPWLEQTLADLAPGALEFEQDEIVLPAYGGWISGPCLDPGPGDAAVEPPASPGPDQDSEITWTAPPGDEPRSEETGASLGRGSMATATLTPAPSEWLAEQLDVLRSWSEWQQRKAAILA